MTGVPREGRLCNACVVWGGGIMTPESESRTLFDVKIGASITGDAATTALPSKPISDATGGPVTMTYSEPLRPRVYDHLVPLLGRRFRNRDSGRIRRLTFVGVTETDKLLQPGPRDRFGRSRHGLIKRVSEVRVQLDERLDIGAEAFVRRWDLVED